MASRLRRRPRRNRRFGGRILRKGKEWIFRHLPGPLWLRIIIAIVLVLVAVYLLMEYVFPHFAEYGPFNQNVTINH